MNFLLFLILALIIIGLIIYTAKINNERNTKELMSEADSFIEKIIRTKSLEPISANINLKIGEKAFLQCNSILKETRNIRYYQSEGVGFRALKRVYFGTIRGKSQSQEEFKDIDAGTLTLTNKRIVFNGISNSRNVQISKLIAVNALRFEIEISSESRQRNMIFTVPNPLIWEYTIRLLTSISDPLNLTESEIMAINYENKTIVDKSLENISINQPQPSKQKEISDDQRTNDYIYGNYQSKIQENYRVKRDNLKNTFKFGYDFLRNLESNDKDIWVGTSTNVHLYLRNNYLAYIIINNNSLSIRARFNVKIFSGTIDRSREMFTNHFSELISAHGGFKNGWAVRRGEFYIFNNSTPNKFFVSLIEYITELNLG